MKWIHNKYLLQILLVCALAIFGGRMIWDFAVQLRVKEFGGTMTINLPPNVKLVNISWKDGRLWYVTRPMTNDEDPITSTFQEQSVYGVFQGQVTVVESRNE